MRVSPSLRKTSGGRHLARGGGRWKKALSGSTALALALGALVVTSSANVASAAAGTVTGTVFEDFNDNGYLDTIVSAYQSTDVGVAGVAVTATNAAGTVVASTTTAANGTYSLVTGAIQVRIEFTKPTGWSDGAKAPSLTLPANSSAASETAVQFIDASVANPLASFGMVRPNSYNSAISTANAGGPVVPYVAVPLQASVLSNNVGTGSFTTNLATRSALLGYQYSTATAGGWINATTGSFDATGPFAKNTAALATQSQVGSIWGTANYGTNQVVSAAIFKRFTAVGPGGLGQIYTTSLTGLNQATGAGLTANATPLVTIPNTGTNPRPAGTDWTAGAINTGYDWFHDTPAYSQVGKIGLGDIDITFDQTKLYAVNLNDRQLYEVPLTKPATAGAAPIVGTPVAIALPLTLPGAAQGCAQAQVRPFGLGEYAGKMYITLTCTGPNTSDLRGYVYSMDEKTRVFSAAPVLEVALNYDRGFVARINGTPTGAPAEFGAWTDTFATAPVGGLVTPPQPILSNLAFDANGTISLSIKDRTTDQNGVQGGSPNAGDSGLYNSNSAGELLKFCGTPTSGWTQESNGICGGVTGNESGIGYGPGGGLFYRSNFQHGDTPGGANFNSWHDQVLLGSALQIPGLPTIMTTSMDPYAAVYGGTGVNSGFNQSGFRVLNSNTGAWSYAGTLSSSVSNTNAQQQNGAFGKAGGLGDLSALVPVPPIEIGNRVWRDTDKDGVQDAGEPPIAGVTVNLYAADGTTLIATAVTDATGEYYFSSAVGTSTASARYGLAALTFETDYVVKLDNAANYAAAGPLFGLTATQTAVGADREIDSNGVIVSSTNVSANVTTGVAGANDHSLDFGFTPPSYSLGNRLWLDTGTGTNTNNGVLDLGESPVPANTVVELLDATGTTVLQTKTTDANGYYRFDGLDPIGYRVRVAASNFATGGTLVGYLSSTPAPAGFTTVADNNKDHGVDSATPATTGITSNTVTLTAANLTGEVDGTATGQGLNGPFGDASDNLTVDFGFFKPSVSVGDFVWRDTDADGVQDAGEPGINGVTMTLTGPGGVAVTDVNGNAVGPVQTAGNGGYTFTNLPVLPAGQHYTVTIDSASPALVGLTPTLTGQGSTTRSPSTTPHPRWPDLFRLWPTRAVTPLSIPRPALLSRAT